MAAIGYRMLVIAVGGTAAVYGLWLLQGQWAREALAPVSTAITRGEPYKAEVLGAFVPFAATAEEEEPCRPGPRHDAAVLRLRLAEIARNAKDSAAIDKTSGLLNHSLMKALNCSPSDPFLWLALFTLRNADRFHVDSLPLLELSYQTGPREGWIALNRNHIALSYYFVLPDDMKKAALAEFKALLNEGFYQETAPSFMRAAPLLQKALRARVDELEKERRKAFSRTLYNLGFEGELPENDQFKPRFGSDLGPLLR